MTSLIVTSFQSDLEEMSDDEFRDNVEALAIKRLEKPKTMKAQASRYWTEVDSGFYLFERSNLFNSFFIPLKTSY